MKALDSCGSSIRSLTIDFGRPKESCYMIALAKLSCAICAAADARALERHLGLKIAQKVSIVLTARDSSITADSAKKLMAWRDISALKMALGPCNEMPHNAFRWSQDTGHSAPIKIIHGQGFSMRFHMSKMLRLGISEAL